MESRLTLSNRLENLKVLRDFLQVWAKRRGLPKGRRESLEKAATEVFRYLVSRVYRPGQPGSIAIVLEDKGSRIRLMFEDDAPAYNPVNLSSSAAEAKSPELGGDVQLNAIPQLGDSLIYYRTADQKNRLVVFLTR
ncbi:MAG: ATP-binding protein [Thermodesulfobacteriota bacterium]